jgi:hypothetical protein
MSTAMVLHHQRAGDGAQQGASERVAARCRELLRLLPSEAVRQRLETLLAAAAHHAGDDVAFLDRWGYDAEQRAAIAAAIEAVAEG